MKFERFCNVACHLRNTDRCNPVPAASPAKMAGRKNAGPIWRALGKRYPCCLDRRLQNRAMAYRSIMPEAGSSTTWVRSPDGIAIDFDESSSMKVPESMARTDVHEYEL